MLSMVLLVLLSIFYSEHVLSNQSDNQLLDITVKSQKHQKIDFLTLTNHVIYEEFDDPFGLLDYEELDKLAIIVNYQDAKSAGSSMSKQQTQEHDKLKIELEKQAINVDQLLEIRLQMIAQWEEQNESVNPLIVNQNIEIEGFVLPLEWQGKKLSEFLLVPFIGACIHKPAPPPNQVIYAKLKTPINFSELNTFASVTVKGFLTSEFKSPELTLVDGTQPVTTSYSLETTSIKINKTSIDAW